MVGRLGFEPRKAEPADLQSAPFDRSGICPLTNLFCFLERGVSSKRLEPTTGLEPVTYSLPWSCSTN